MKFWLKLVIASAFCLHIFSAFASPTIYEGNLRLGSHPSINELERVPADANMSALALSLGQAQNEQRVDSKSVLKVTTSSPNQLVLLSNAKAESSTETNRTTIDTNVDTIVQQFEHSQWYIYAVFNDETVTLKGFDSRSQKNIEITTLPKPYKMFTLTNTGHIFTTNGTHIFHVQLFLRGEHIQINDEWTPVPMESDVCAGNIETFSISHFGNKIALQCDTDA